MGFVIFPHCIKQKNQPLKVGFYTLFPKNMKYARLRLRIFSEVSILLLFHL